MAVSLVNNVVGDLCLGKPGVKSLCVSTSTVADALAAVKAAEDHQITLWSCHHHHHHHQHHQNPPAGKIAVGDIDVGLLCECVGKIGMVDIICFLCKEENLVCPASALNSSVSAILPLNNHTTTTALVKHVDPSTSLLEALDLFLRGTQSLVVPIQNPKGSHSRRKQLEAARSCSPTYHNGREYCFLTQEDMIQFFLSRIGLLPPIPNFSIEMLGLIRTDILVVDYHTPAAMALDAIAQSLANHTSVGVVDEDGALVGEISPHTLACCDETIAAAIMTLSSGDLMSYID